MRWMMTGVLWTLVCVSQVAGQGRTDYMNVESPQVHPIEIAVVNNHQYLLICNTPDNSVEIWDTDESITPAANRFIMRVRTGLEPVTVRWYEPLQRFYVANFLGDSITSVQLAATGGPASLRATGVQTTWVGDEPMDLAFHSFAEDDGAGGTSTRHTFFVSLMTLDAFGWWDARNLLVMGPGLEAQNALVDSQTDIDFDGNDDLIAIKEPRALAVTCGKLFILGFKGGNTPTFYDFDLYSLDLATGVTRALGGIGSTNYNMAFASAGDLYIVGGEALNITLQNEPEVADAATGFVQSTLYRVENACGESPTIHRRDLNLAPGVGGPPTPVPKTEALAQPTDIALFEQDGLVRKVFVTAFGSDRVGVLAPNPAVSPIDWPRRFIDLGPVTGSSNPKAGPRGLALSQRSRNPRLYALNRFDNSVTVIDPVAETQVDEFALNQDPTPDHIRAGRHFLYDAEISGNGFVSCASCHTDGRTDALAWDLATPTPNVVGDPIPPLLLDSLGFTLTHFPDDKDYIVTQSLQGLLNFEVDPEAQNLFTNAPYHWRGDRADFTAFNPAFVGLLGAEDELSPEDMKKFEEFINSVHYPGNPKQPLDRIYSGEIGTLTDPGTDGTGSGARLGLKLFHIRSSDGTGACVHCHALPEASNNRLTEQLDNLSPHFPFAISSQPIETAALRGLFQRESRLDADGSSDHNDSPITNYEGLTLTGLIVGPQTAGPDINQVASINAFNRHFFSGTFCGGTFCGNLEAVNQFVHEMDWGVSPLVGNSYTVTSANKGLAATTDALIMGEEQAGLANAGLSVQAWINGVQRGFWFDPITQLYVEEPGGATQTRTALLALVGHRDRLVLIASPLGSERRLASPSGTTVPLTGPAPTGVSMLPMVPATHNEDIPSLTTFWQASDPTLNQHGGAYSHSVRLFQYGLTQDGPPGGFGLSGPRHDAPRRFQVSGINIRFGAVLIIYTHDDSSSDPPPMVDPNLGPEDPAQVQVRRMVLPIHPTDEVDSEENPVWETVVEMEPLLYYRMMLGGEFAQGVATAFNDQAFVVPEPPMPGMFNPIAWNLHYVRVRNADGSQFDVGWVPLRIQ